MIVLLIVLSLAPFALKAQGPGEMLPNLTSQEREVFCAGKEAFLRRNSVQGEKMYPDTEVGLGPLYNLDSCGGCHAHPTPGGSSPRINPQHAAATRAGAANTIPEFVTLDGPAYQVRVAGKGEVFPLFSIGGRKDAPDCAQPQPDLGGMHRRGKLRMRIPTPLYGAGLIEAIPVQEIVSNQERDREAKSRLGIRGRVHWVAPGIAGRFGWKAQSASLEEFAAEAYWTEQGVTNDRFPSERVPVCAVNRLPEDTFKLGGKRGVDGWSNVVRFAYFMRLLGPPVEPAATDTVREGQALFVSAGCTGCHTPVMKTGASAYTILANQEVRLYSDLLLHNMGGTLADDIPQGEASGTEFRTAPLWGLRYRLFLLHDGRSRSIEDSVRAHGTDARSEAYASVRRFVGLSDQERLALIEFLKTL
jgi:CxxC motif-containing protein (DUF1111 family)